MKTIYFITSNASKYRDFTTRIDSQKWRLIHFPAELNELQSLDGMEITKHKLAQAKKLLPGKRVIVEDRGFYIPALNNFPGPFIKLILKSIGIDELLRMMRGKKDRTAKFISILGYFDGKEEHYFIDEEIGFLTKNKRGTNIRGWTDLLYIYGYTTFPHKTLAQLNDDEWNQYIQSLAKGDYLRKFTLFLEQNR